MIATGLAVSFILATVFPGAGLMVRRLHDIGLPGWLCLLALIPSFGTIVMIVFGLVPSQAKDNQWGPSPS